VPRLSFHLDETIKKQAEFEGALAEAREGDAGPPGEEDQEKDREDEPGSRPGASEESAL
jgi:hypothetical protein